MEQWISAVVYALAVARLTRLVTADKVFDFARNWLIGRLPDEHPAAYLVTCRWCTSVWIAAPAAAVWYLWGLQPWFLIPAAALAFSHLTGLLAGLERD